MPFIPALWTQRQEDLCEFQDSLVHIASSQIPRITQRYVLKKEKKRKIEKEKKK